MKILMLSPKLPYPPRDGGAIATLSLAEGLSDAGADITLLCLNTSKHHNEISQVPSNLRKKIRFIAVNHNTQVNPLKALNNLLFSKEPYNGRRFFSVNFQNRLTALLRQEKFDIVQLEGPYMGYYLPVIRNLHSSPISLRAHNAEHEIWQGKSRNSRNFFLKYYFSNLSKRILRLEKSVISQCNMLISISDRDRQLLCALHSIPSITISPGLNAASYPAPENPGYPTLFFIGALDWQPNLEGLFWFLDEVFPAVCGQLPNIELHIAGRNAHSGVEKKLSSLKSRGIIYHGEVENACDFMNKYAILISPLFSGSGIRIKIIEALMMNRAVVATSVAAAGISSSNFGALFVEDRAREIGEIIVSLCSDRSAYEEKVRNARTLVLQNFNNLASSNKLLEYYRNNPA